MVSENSPNIDDLLVKVMLGESTGEERRVVEDWIAGSPANERYFQDLKRIWEDSRKLAVQSVVDADAAWVNFRERVSAGRTSEGERETGGAMRGALVIDRGAAQERGMGRGRHYTWMRVAAIFLVVVAGGWFYYTYSYKPNLFLSVNSGVQVLSDTLPEGSVVTLNRESSIRYKRQFAGDMRRVDMEGEAFFSVAPDKSKPFKVNTNGVTITVLGTSFNVKTTAGVTEVIVETGMVEISKNGRAVRVGAHEKAVIGKDNAAPVKENNTDVLYNYYRTNAFECNGIPLWRLVEKLNEVYKERHIVIGNNRLRDLRLTTTLTDVSLDDMLKVVAKSLVFTIEYKGQEIILK